MKKLFKLLVVGVSVYSSNVYANNTSTAFECMQKNIYFEARNQSFVGKLAVGLTVLNRVESAKYPDDVCSVIYQAKTDKKGSPIRNNCQFSWYCDGKSDNMLDEDAAARAALAAWVVLQKNFIDITEGATHYHAEYVTPSWANNLERITKIDHHIFYKYP